MTVNIAIVGGGPRGLWALEELAAISFKHFLALDVTVFDPHPLGVGSAYSTEQPHTRIVNVRSSVIRTAAGTLDDYRRAHGEQDPLDPFPPRALVGEFLRHSAEQLLSTLPAQMKVTHETRTVHSFDELDGFDEVLVVTGHPRPQHPEGFLDPHNGDIGRVTPGSTVAIRGAALTFIDVVMELTLGRGGTILDGRYVASGSEPARIVPYTRTGRTVQVKPAPATAEERRCIDDYAPSLRAVRTPAELIRVVCDAASAIAGQRVTLDDARRSHDPAAIWRASLEPGRLPAQALGLVWRELYPHVIELVRTTLTEPTEELLDLYSTLEAVTYGPPAAQIQNLLALHDAGILDLSGLEEGPHPDADHRINAVQAPFGVNDNELLNTIAPLGPLVTDDDGYLPAHRDTTPSIAAIGRATEPRVLGNDSLNRDLHAHIPNWARSIAERYGRPQAHGLPPLTGRLEPWMNKLIHHPETATSLIAQHNSPVNALEPTALARNAAELVDAGTNAGIDVRIFFARKANKALAFVDAAARAGHGVDVASHRELQQVINRGVPGERIILSAAVKDHALLELAVDNGVTVSLDNVTELQRLAEGTAGRNVNVAPRLAPDPSTLPPTRFGELAHVWATAFDSTWPGINPTGVHVHLHGYSAQDRAVALDQAINLCDALTERGHHPTFIDLGGGVPMSYLDNPDEWNNYHAARQAMVSGRIDPFTWKADPLNSTYPFHQQPTRGAWLEELLASDAAQRLKQRGLRLHLEPGRSLLDGCGATLAEVSFVKTRSDGLPLVGLAMNRTQLRTTSDDYLIDPLHIPRTTASGEAIEAFLVGAYCIEDELIVRRAIRFPNGVAPGDIVVFPNTAGYFMHILESASHQIPLAKNVVDEGQGFRLDAIDQPGL